MSEILYELTTIPTGVCCKGIKVFVDNTDIVQGVQFIGGCPGNAKALDALIRGMHVKDVIQKLKGIECGSKKTSCADQLAQYLEQWCGPQVK